MVRRVVSRLVPAQEDGRELVEGELSVWRRVLGRSAGAYQLVLGVRLRARVSGWERAASGGHRTRHHPTEIEAVAERLAHVPDALEIGPNEALPQRLVVGRQGAATADRLAAAQSRERRLGCKRARLDRVM